MAADWAFYFLTRPVGLLVMASFLALAFAVWRLSLGAAAFHRVGQLPLWLGLAAAVLGVLCLAFVYSYFEFSERVAQGVLKGSDRWGTVFSWSTYLAVLALAPVLPLLGLVATLFAGILVRAGRLSILRIVVAVGVFALACTALMWALPGNAWSVSHRLEHFLSLLHSIGLGVLVVGLCFLLAVYAAIRARDPAALGR